MSHNALCDNFFSLLNSSNLSREEIVDFVSQYCTYSPRSIYFNSMLNVISSLVYSKIEFTSDRTGTMKARDGLISADVHVIGEGDKIARIALVPDLPHVSDFGTVSSVLHDSDISLSFRFLRERRIVDRGDLNVPIMSISKLFVCAPLLMHASRDPSFLARRIECPGLAEKDFGLGDRGSSHMRSFRLGDLVTRSLLASDNLATDRLLLYIQEHQESFDFVDCWRNVDLSLSEYAEGVFDENLSGFFKRYSKRDVFKVLDYFRTMNWTPFDDLPKPLSHFLFKGGSGPGIISGVWSSRLGGAPSEVLFSCWREGALSILEEIFIIQYFRSVFENISNTDLTLAEDGLL